MASNVTLNSGSGGASLYTKQVTHDGDTAQIQGVTLAGISGSEDAYTAVDVAAGGGVEAAALRVTIASDSTGVLSVDDNGSSLTVDNAGLTALNGAISGTEVQVDIVSSAAIPITDNSGSITVDGSLTVDLGGNNDVTIDGSSIVKAEDAVHSTGDAGVMLLSVRRDTAAVGSGTDGDYSTINVDGSGRVWVHDPVSVALLTTMDADTSTLAGAVSGTEMQVDILTIAAGDNNIGNVDIVSLPASTNTLEVVGDAADDAAAAGNPVLVAGVAIETDGTDPGSVSAEGDAAFLRTDRNRRLLVNTSHPRGLHARDNGGTAETDTEVIAAPGAGLSIYITDIDFSTDTAETLTIHEDEGGAGEAVIYGPWYLPATGGFVKHFATPIRCTANLSVGYTTTATGNHTLHFGYYIAP